MSGERQIDIAELAAMLNDDCEAIVQELIPDAEFQGGTRLICRGLLGGKGDQTSIHLRGVTRGRYKCFGGVDIAGAPESGDMLDLAAWILFDGDKKQAFQWALARFGLSDRAGPETQAKLAARRREAAARQAERERQAEADGRRRIGQAWAQWKHESRPIVGADGSPTLAALYLQARGIDFGRIPSLGALRFHPGLAPMAGDPIVPAMTAIMADETGRPCACHRTALEARPDGTVGKSGRVKNVKTIMGRPKGAFIAINRGSSGKTLSAAPDGETLVVCEGIEDALTLCLARPSLRIVAAGTLGAMSDVAPPPAVKTLVLYRDRDHKPQALADFERSLARQIERGQPFGRRVVVAMPPEGVKDANEHLMREELKWSRS